MKNILVAISILFFGSFANSQDLQTVLTKCSKSLNLEARKSLPNLRTDGFFVMSGTEARVPFKLIQERPDHLRVETTVFGFKAIQTYDGVTAWMLTPTQGMEAVKTDSRDMEFIAAATAIDGPFSLNKNSKYMLKYLGEDKYQEKAMQVIAWVSDDERLKFYINNNSWLIDGVRYEYKKNGGWYSMEYRIKSYKTYEGSKFPDKIAAVVNGVEMLSISVSEFRTIDDLDSSKFSKPSYN